MSADDVTPGEIADIRGKIWYAASEGRAELVWTQSLVERLCNTCDTLRAEVQRLTAERDAMRAVLNRALAVADDLGVEELGWMREARKLLKEGSAP